MLMFDGAHHKQLRSTYGFLRKRPSTALILIHPISPKLIPPTFVILIPPAVQENEHHLDGVAETTAEALRSGDVESGCAPGGN